MPRTDASQVEPDRRRPSPTPLGRAGAGDVVLIAGKGHETTQVVRRPRSSPSTTVRWPARCWPPSATGVGPRDPPPRSPPASPRRVARRHQGPHRPGSTRRHIGQPIREDVPEGHTIKAGTPTMGGRRHRRRRRRRLPGVGPLRRRLHPDRPGRAWAPSSAPASSGSLDDWIKVANERNLGLNKRAKMIGLLAGGDRASPSLMLWTRPTSHTTICFTRWNDLGWELGKVGWASGPCSSSSATTNAVNLTDGLDGLAAGSVDLRLRRPSWSSASGPSATRASTAINVRPRPGRRGRRHDGGVRRLPVVERRAGADLHGRHRLAGHRRRPGRAWRSSPTRRCCCRSSGRCSCVETVSVILQVGQLPARSAAASSAWRRSTTTSSWGAGPRPRSSSASGCCRRACTAVGLGLFYADFIQSGGLG